MSCDLAASVGSLQHWLWDTARKMNAFLCFLLFWNSFTWYNFGTTDWIQVGFSAKCTSSTEDFNQIENWKCHMLDFQLIPLDCITYYWKEVNFNIFTTINQLAATSPSFASIASQITLPLPVLLLVCDRVVVRLNSYSKLTLHFAVLHTYSCMSWSQSDSPVWVNRNNQLGQEKKCLFVHPNFEKSGNSFYCTKEYWSLLTLKIPEKSFLFPVRIFTF